MVRGVAVQHMRWPDTDTSGPRASPAWDYQRAKHSTGQSLRVDGCNDNFVRTLRYQLSTDLHQNPSHVGVPYSHPISDGTSSRSCTRSTCCSFLLDVFDSMTNIRREA